MYSQITLISVFIFSIIFLFGYKLRFPNQIMHRGLLSFSAGIAIAYVFVHLIPELQDAKYIFVRETAHRALAFPEQVVYLSAMFGFILSYGLEKMVSWSSLKLHGHDLLTEKHKITFLLHLIGYSIYVWLVTYLMIRNPEVSTSSITLYTIAMGFHFLGLDFYFYREYKQFYTKLGRYVLAMAAVIGWGVGALIELDKVLIIILLGFISGAIIMNSMIMELPQGKDGKFWPFLLGGLFYSSLLLTIG